jgi:hypothetical protein
LNFPIKKPIFIIKSGFYYFLRNFHNNKVTEYAKGLSTSIQRREIAIAHRYILNK